MHDERGHTDQESLREIAEILERHGVRPAACGPAEKAAREWLSAGFDDPEEVEGWLKARCFDASAARALEDAGLTPEQAALRTRAGAADYEDTVGYKYANGDLSTDEARRVITSDFWDT